MTVHLKKDNKSTLCGLPLISRWQQSLLNHSKDPAEVNCNKCLQYCSAPIPRISMHALCAKAIKKELSQCFPGKKFTIRSKSYSGGNRINIFYPPGSSYEQVHKVTIKYQHGYLDSTDNSYHYTGSSHIITSSGSIEEVPSVKFVILKCNSPKEICRDKTSS